MIPEQEYTIDVYAVLILLGLLQAFLLGAFYLSKRNISANFYQGLLFLSLGAIMLEIFMMYSGYIQHAFFLVDYSESLGLALGPLFYGAVMCLIRGNAPWHIGWHFIPFFIYSFLLIPFLLFPDIAKYNAWVVSYHPEWEIIDFNYPYTADIFNIRSYITLTTILHIGFYGVLCLYEVLKVFRKAGENIFTTQRPVWQALRMIPFYIFSILLLVLVVKLVNVHDTGDYLFATYISVVVYLSSFQLLRTSTLWSSSTIEGEKYRSSGLTNEKREALLAELEKIMRNKKWFARNDSTLPGLAAHMNTTVHQLSQAINEGLGKSYFELLAIYRVDEAMTILQTKSGSSLKLEEIAEQVGYNSKSAFNNAFKKITGMTPSQFRDQAILKH